jgi:DNA modification methylase
MNYIYNDDCLNVLPAIETESVDLIIADPPYWKVVNQEWDYQWRTEKDYIQWTTDWVKLSLKTLRLGGTFYLFGYFRTLALLIEPLEQLGLELRQQIIIDKGLRAISGRATKGYKQFPNTTESLLMFIKDAKPFIRSFLKERQLLLGLSSKEINERLGVKSNGGGMWSIYTGKNVCEQVPTLELWNKLGEILEFDFPYNQIAQTFNPQMGLTDVWTDIDFYSEKRIHPTQKPIKLIKRLVEASSNEGDLVLDPFSGSGTTAIVCKALGRNSILIEKSPEYYALTLERIKECFEVPTIFSYAGAGS